MDLPALLRAENARHRGADQLPFASILKHIWYAQRSGKLGALRRVEFIWSCRDTGSFGWFQTLLEEIEEAQTDRKWVRHA